MNTFECLHKSLNVHTSEFFGHVFEMDKYVEVVTEPERVCYRFLVRVRMTTQKKRLHLK